MSSSSSSNTNEQTEKNIPIVSTNTNINLKELYERPAQELCRAKVILHCRDEFQKLCHQFFPWINHIPVEILDRWIFLQLAVPSHERTTKDPIITKPELLITTDVVRREVLNLVCGKIPGRYHNQQHARRLIMNNTSALENVLKYVCHGKLDPIQNLLFVKHFQKTREFVTRTNVQNKLALDDQELTSMMSTCRTFTNDIAIPICKQAIDQLCHQFLEIVDCEISNLFKWCEEEQQQQEKEKVSVIFVDDEWRIRFDNDQLALTDERYQLLLERMKNSVYFTTENEFGKDAKHVWPSLLYVLLKRYETLTGPRGLANMHAAVPSDALAILKKHLSVGTELFASPFNCYLPNYYSAFYDIDRFFGSSGSFFDGPIKSGSYEVNPPFVEEVMDQMADRLEFLLSNTEEPLSFVIVVPSWRIPMTPAIQKLESSNFLVSQHILRGGDYSYINGEQHRPSHKRRFSEMKYVAPHASELYVLQNKRGQQIFPFANDLLPVLINAWQGNS